MIRSAGRLVARLFGGSRPARAGGRSDESVEANEVTDEQILRGIIKDMKRGSLPWHRPWSETSAVRIGSVTHAPAWPGNLRAPDTPFGVFNGTKLLTRTAQAGYRTNLWVANEVVRELGARLVEDDGLPTRIDRYSKSDTRYAPQRRGTRLVYNIDQVEDCERTLGLSFVGPRSSGDADRYQPSKELLERLTRDRGLRLVSRKQGAAYSPSLDTVMMPVVGQFAAGDGEDHYWATLWHEVVHWTGHQSRLDRERHMEWGDRIYAFEELVAELGAAFLCARLGVEGELQHERYLRSWADKLEADGMESLWDAAALAHAAKDFVLRERTQAPRRRNEIPF